jgi:ABC-type amino acid transport substrate-binding protein
LAIKPQGKNMPKSLFSPSLWRGIISLALLLIVHGVFADDLKDVRERGVLRHLGVPYANFVTGSGDGLDVEIVQLFARHIGVRYEYVPSTWPNLISDLTGKTIEYKPVPHETTSRPVRGDMIASGLTVLPLRKKFIDYSDPTFPSAVWLLARPQSTAQPIKPTGKRDLDIKATKAMMKHGATFVMDNVCLDPKLYNLEGKGLQLKRFTGSLSVNDIVPAVVKGDADMTLLDVPDIMIAVEKWPGQFKIIGPISEEQRMAAAFRKDSPELREAFNRFLAGIKADGTYMKLIRKYFPVAPRYLPGFFQDIPAKD